MLRRVQQYIQQHGLLRKGERVLVCVSGGADSMALLDVLQRGGYDCVVAHCNFHLRGEESDRDEQIVRQSALLTTKDHRLIPLYVKHFDTIAYAQEQRCSIEVAARNLRYEWFAQLAQELECQAIAVAHHQNDQAETVLLNLRRGTGIRGLCGMRAKSKNPVTESDIPVIRPLLCTTHQYILHYLRDIRKIEWAEDSSNADTSFTRNAIRQEIAHYTQAEIEHIATTAEHMQGYVDWLEGNETTEAGRAKLHEELRGYGFAEIDKIYDALQRGVGGKTFYSTTYQAIIKKGKLEVTPLKI